MHMANLCVLLLVLALGLTGAAPSAFAMHEESAGDLENLRHRIETLERQSGASEPGTAATTLGEWAGHIELSGLIEVEASYARGEGGAETGDLTLATAQFGLEAQVMERAGAHLVLLYEEGESEALNVDEAAVNLTLLESHLALAAGKQYLPFGKFHSRLVSDPLTLDLGETNDTALIVHGGRPGRFELKLGAFNGQADRVGHDDRIDSWVAALEVTPGEGVAFGASYLSDLAESDLGLVLDDPLIGNIYNDSIPAAAGFVSLGVGPVTLGGEYLAALDDFAPAVVALGTDLTGQRPQAWNLELAVTPAAGWEVAARYEVARNFRNDLLRYGAAVSCEVYAQTIVAVEYLHGDAKAVGNDPTHTVTVQLAAEF